MCVVHPFSVLIGRFKQTVCLFHWTGKRYIFPALAMLLQILRFNIDGWTKPVGRVRVHTCARV